MGNGERLLLLLMMIVDEMMMIVDEMMMIVDEMMMVAMMMTGEGGGWLHGYIVISRRTNEPLK